MNSDNKQPRARYVVQVIDSGTQAVVQEIEAHSERSAERIDSGLNINLHHAKYHTNILDREAEAEAANDAPRP